MFGSLKLTLIFGVLIAGLVGGFVLYYKDTQNRLKVLQENNAKLETAVQTQSQTIDVLQSDAKKFAELNSKLRIKLDDAEKDKDEFDKDTVLNRFNYQLKKSGLKTFNTLKPDFNWACESINEIKSQYNLKKYIILFPFCSSHLSIKKWPYFNDLIKLILNKFSQDYKIIIAPGSKEIDDAKKINATCILDKDKSLNISQLTSLIKDSSFVVANDTGPAHIAAHVGAKGLALFGKHISASKVSIERQNFKPIEVADLNNLSAEKVFERLSSSIS